MALALFAIPLASLLLTQVPAKPTTPTTRVEGWVVDADSRTPLVGARVSLIPPTAAPDGVIRELMHTLTDASGHFAFEGVAQGRYGVNAKKDGYAWAPDRSDSRAIDVAAGQMITGLRIAIRKAGVLEGRILDDSGAPVPGEVVVWALRQDIPVEPLGWAPGGGAGTNDRGEFRIANLPEGPYLLRAMPQASVRLRRESHVGRTAFAPTYYPGTTDRQAALIVMVPSGHTVGGMQFLMVSAPAFDVSGVVVDAAGASVGGAVVRLVRAREPSFTRVIAHAQRDGTFRIRGIIPDAYRIMVETGDSASHDGFGPVGVDGIAEAYWHLDPQEVIVDNADVAGVRIVVPAQK